MRRAVLFALIDGVFAALLGAFVSACAEIAQNDYLAHRLFHLPLFLISDQLRALFWPSIALGLFAGVGGFIVSAVHRRGVVAASLAGLGWLGLAVVAARFAYGLVSVIADRLPASGAAALKVQRLHWTTLGARQLATLFIIVILATVFRAACVRRPWANLWLERRLPLASLSVALLVLVGTSVDRQVRVPQSSRKNVILIVLDTVAARHMASYGYWRTTTPELDALATKGTLFTNVFSMAPWTLPSHASFFTGLAPIHHRATQESLALSRSFDTVAETLRNDGYRTFAAVGNPVVDAHTGLDQGFAEFFPTWRGDVAAAYSGVDTHPNNAALLRFLAQLDSKDSFFAFLNYNDAHGPYHPPQEEATPFLPAHADRLAIDRIDQSWQRYYAGTNPLGRQEFETLTALYDAELSHVSRVVGELLEALESSGVLDDTLVLITADHGENVGEHGHFDHVFNLYDSLLHVPLFVVGSGSTAGRRDQRPVDNADVYRTILAAARSSAAQNGAGGDDLLQREPTRAAGESDRLAEYYFPSQALSTFEPGLLVQAGDRLEPYLRRIRSIRHEGWKLIWGSDGKAELYHVRDDPDETINLATEKPQLVAELTTRLEQRLSAIVGQRFSLRDEPPPAGGSGFEDLDSEAMERLRSLGYVQ